MLAAGKGTRLFPLTGEIPKPLAPVVDTPIIEHIFELLARHGVEEAYVNVHSTTWPTRSSKPTTARRPTLTV